MSEEVDVDRLEVTEFLARPLVARLALNGRNGPTVRSVSWVYEGGVFWWLTGPSYSRLSRWLAEDPRVAMTIDTCDLDTGQVLAVTVTSSEVSRRESAQLTLTGSLGFRNRPRFTSTGISRPWPCL